MNYIIIHLAHNGEFDSALHLVSTIDDTQEKNHGYFHIVSAYLDSSYDDKAVQLSDSIKDNKERAFTLNIIATHYARIDSIDKAEMFLEQSLAVARTIEDYQERAQNLFFIAGTYQFIKQEDQVLAILSEAVETIDMAPDTVWFKVNTMVDIAGKYIDFGKKEKAKSLLHRALRLAEKNIPEYFRDLRMADIAQKYASMGMFRTALEISDSIKVVDQKGRALAYIAISYIKDGYIQKAKQIAETIENPYSNYGVMIAIANKYIEKGNYDSARNLIQSIKNPAAQADGFCWLAHKYIKMEQLEKAMGYLKEAQVIIATAEDDLWKSYALNTIADLYIKMEKPNSTLDFLLQSRSVANTLEDDHEKSLCLFGVVKGLIQINQLHLALETTAMIVSSYLKVSTLILIQEICDETGEDLDKKTEQILQKIENGIGKKPIKSKKPRVYRSDSLKIRR